MKLLPFPLLPVQLAITEMNQSARRYAVNGCMQAVIIDKVLDFPEVGKGNSSSTATSDSPVSRGQTQSQNEKNECLLIYRNRGEYN